MPGTSRRYAGLDSSSPDVVRRGDVRRFDYQMANERRVHFGFKRSLVLPQAPGVVENGRSDSVMQLS